MTRTKRITCIMAVMLCVAAFLFPMTAYALSDTTAPTISAKINGDTLHAEASDADSGVEAIYINGSRYNYLVDGAIDIPLKDCAGTEAYISVHAIDFAGNKSKTVQLNNPYYVAPATTPAQTGTTPAPVPSQTPAASTPSPTQRPTAASTPAQSATPTPTASAEPEATESSVPDAQQPFTPDGTGTVVDDIMEPNGKEFLTITTPDGNVFYLIIDRARDDNGVYLLNAVTEDDLMSLAKEGDGKGTSESAVPTPEPTPSQTEPTPEPTPEPETPAKDSGSTGTIILVLLAVAAVGGAGYYIKIYRPKQQAAEPDDMDEDELDFEDAEPDGGRLPEESEDGEDEDAGEEPDEDTGDDYEDE